MDIVATNLRSFDEKKEDRPNLMSEDITPPSSPPRFAASGTLSASKRRAKNAGAAGLSELSKQLRILQAKNEAQSVEINRLERQLKILAELQGISVADLRAALENACANEAFGELQHRVKKLRFELEAATLAKQKELGQDAAAPHIANLELRVGELEEVEQRHEKEVMDLYDQLRHEKARATRLEAEGAQFKKDSEEYENRLANEMERAARLEANFQEQLQKHQNEQARKMQELAKIAKQAEAEARNRAAIDAHGKHSDPTGTNGLNSIGPNGQPESMINNASSRDAGGGDISSKSNASAITPGMADEFERMVKLLKEKDDALSALEARIKAEREDWMRKLKENENGALESLTKLQMEKDQMALTIKQLQDTESQNDLRLAQFRARFAVQDERIKDMEQQLSSLYTAFGLLKEDQDAEDQKRVALESNLNDADEEYARHINDSQKKKNEAQSRAAQRNHLPPSVTDPWGVSGTRNHVVESPVDPWNAAQQATSPNDRASTNNVPRTITTPTASETSPNGRFSHSPYTNSFNEDSAMATPRASYPSDRFTRTTTPERAYATSPAASTPSTWQLIFPESRVTNTKSYASRSSPGHNGLLIKGMLIVKSKSLMKKWKPRHSKLYLQGNHYQWDMEGKSYTLGFGVSKVEFYPNHPLSFTVYTNPYDEMAPVIHAATSTEADYHRWMAALTKATTGGTYEALQMEGSPRRPREERSSVARTSFQSPGDDTIVSALSVEDQEAADLNRALRLSTTMT